MNATPAAPPPRKREGRARLLVIVVLVFAAAGIGWGAWWFLVGRWSETTDDAYVGGNLVQVTPQAAGTVVAIHADDTDFVKAGQVLVELDQADARLAAARAETQLARAVRQVRNLFATDAQLQASVAVRRTELARAREDVARRVRVSESGAVSAEELQHARDAQKNAEAALLTAERQLAAGRTLVDRTSVREHPEVRNAAAQVRDAYLSLARTSLPAPVAGFIARRSVQLGQRVSAGTPLMAVVPLEDVWVDANFKEAQLAAVRVGQPVTLHADLYGSDIDFHGRVAGFGAGTGGAFALLPAQNATGNWIKVVQRVPVRIALDRRELEQHPLQVGLSMHVDVDTHARSGARLPRVARTAQGDTTRVFDGAAAAASQRIEEIIAANGGS
ncbi:MAG TPA: HlyD family efflux transporter periplasmic adaptor subunit [Burkholderiales bacterium]|nr:HlyD family efflux transporter periplasmic adaptor subunit [Burkholderiales bacterium]